MNSIPVLPFLETMITQACNLSCQGCSNYSDIKHSGYVSWQDGKSQLEHWLEKITIPDFGIIGGEPLINPQWKEWIVGVRELMPNTQIRFTTNGLVLDRAPDLFDVCRYVGNIVLKISVHVDDAKLEHYIEQIYNSAQWESVLEHGIRRYRTDNNVRFQVNRPDKFLKTYQGSYENMRPWNSNPEQSFDLCIQQNCPLLYNGKIYKCSTAGLLLPLLNRFGNPNIDQWLPYLDSGISVTDSDTKIKDFLDNFGKFSTICKQCPSTNDASIDHHSTVVFKSKHRDYNLILSN
jgi:organic radical activating enzyme